jgi:osmoprotectant transport system permease protein
MDVSWISFVYERLPELGFRTVQHVMLTGVSTGLAILVGVPLGVAATRVGWMRGTVVGAVGILQTVPSLAMLTLLLVMTDKIGAVPAITALTLYALLPIVRNTITGLDGVPAELMEAARGIGMSRWQQLRLVRIPLALPVIIAGIRTAAVIGVGIATLSAFIGAGGLGQFINRGLALSNTRLIVLGAVPSAMLALAVDFALAALHWAFDPHRKVGRSTRRTTIARATAIALPLLIFGAASLAYSRVQADITIGSKNFTEQILLGHMMAMMIEEYTDLKVDRRFCLGGTMICHRALERGEIDLYAEYTGTALTAILGREVITDPDKALNG